MAVSSPFSLGGTEGRKTTGVNPFGLSGQRQTWIGANSPEYAQLRNEQSTLAANSEGGGTASMVQNLDWNPAFDYSKTGYTGANNGWNFSSADEVSGGKSGWSMDDSLRSYLDQGGFQPGYTEGGQGAYSQSRMAILGPDGQPVSGTEYTNPADTGSDLRDFALYSAALYGAGSGLNAAMGGGGAGAGAGAAEAGTGTMGSGGAAGGTQVGALETMGQVAMPEIGATAAAPTATVGGTGTASGITAQQALGGASALGGVDMGGGEGVDPDMGVAQGSGQGGDPTKAALYGAEGYGSGMTGAETAAYDSTLSQGQMPEWLKNFGTQFGGDAQKLLSQLILAKGVQAAGPKAPATPDYSGLATQQATQNQQTAELNANLNRVNTTTPMGSQTFKRVADPTAPGGYRYESDIKFSPEQQALYDSETANQQSMQDLAGQMQGRVGAGLQNPFSLGGVGAAGKVNADPNAFSAERDQVTQAMYDRMTRTREPAMQRAREQLDTRLKNQGLMPGTEAYDNAMQTMLEAQSGELQDLTSRAIEAGGAEQSRLNAALLANTGFNNQTRSQGIQELLLERQQPLTEFNSLRTGNTPTLPSFQPFGFAQAAPTNTMAPAQMQYGANIDKYNAQVGQYQNLLNFLTKGSGG